MSSHIIPTVILLFQTILLYSTYLQQYKSSIPIASEYIVRSTANVFATSIVTAIYHDTPSWILENAWLMYLIPVVVTAFILLNSIKNGLKFEIFTLYCIVATLIGSVIIRTAWSERFVSFAVIFLFILIIRQFDKRKSLLFKFILLAIMPIIVLNVASGFVISSSADDNWKYVTKVYDPSGKYQCYVGEVPHGWYLFVPCLKPMSNNVTATSIQPGSSSSITGPSITFTAPVLNTTTSIISSSPSTISGLSITFTATVSPMPDGGTVQFYSDNAPIGNRVTMFGGQATFSTSLMSVGSHQISASYLGAPDWYASTSGNTTVTILSISNLKGAKLSGVDLEGINLAGADLEGINLSGANLQYANLSNVNLQGANMTNSLLVGANLKESNLQESNLQNANLQNADLVYANLKKGILHGAILSGANLSNAILSGVNMQDVNTVGANFTGTITDGCNGCPQK